MTNNKTEDEINNVLFQIFYTLECFNRIGFRHNDLHMNNILLFENPVEIRYRLRLFRFTDMKGNVYVKKIPYGKWDVRIFDLDRAQKMPIQSLKEYSSILKDTINVKKHKQLFGNIAQKVVKSDFNDEILLKTIDENGLKIACVKRCIF